MNLERFAPAKVNLFLHVGRRGEDGYHPICSLMAFADLGDRLSLTPGAMSLIVEGPFAGALGPEADNLVIRARDAFLAATARGPANFRLTLTKTLPIASGLGGGSSDAAATLRLLNEALAGGRARAVCRRLAGALGSDTPACLAGIATMALGRGDRLSPPPPFPDLEAVLVNPGGPSETAAVYAAFDQAGMAGDLSPPPWPERVSTPDRMAALLAEARNDLEDPAARLQPAIGEVLRLLRRQPESLLARMSGSGATCFALCRDRREAAGLEARLKDLRPDWWVRRCTLMGRPGVQGERGPVTGPRSRRFDEKSLVRPGRPRRAD